MQLLSFPFSLSQTFSFVLTLSRCSSWCVFHINHHPFCAFLNTLLIAQNLPYLCRSSTYTLILNTTSLTMTIRAPEANSRKDRLGGIFPLQTFRGVYVWYRVSCLFVFPFWGKVLIASRANRDVTWGWDEFAACRCLCLFLYKMCEFYGCLV